jgi:chitodextrinase
VGLPGAADTTPPPAPTGLTATPTSSSQVDLNWSPAGGSGAAAGYRIYRNGSLVGSTTATSYMDTGVTPGTTYTYAVTAYNAAGSVSGPSNVATATTPASGEMPNPVIRTRPTPATNRPGYDIGPHRDALGVPTPLTVREPMPMLAPPTGLVAAIVSSSQINLSWTVPIDDRRVDGYRIYRNGVALAATATTSYADSKLDPGTTYTYTVRAYDTAGTLSPPSISATVKTLPAPRVSVPTRVTATATSPERIEVTWTRPAGSVRIAGYRVFRNGTPISRLVTSTSYSDSSVRAGRTYTYTVIAYDAAGHQSAPISVTATTPQHRADQRDVRMGDVSEARFADLTR